MKFLRAAVLLTQKCQQTRTTARPPSVGMYVEKAVLVGVIGFIFPSCAVRGLISLFLLAFTNAVRCRTSPPTSCRSLAAIAGLSYFATILLKVDLKGVLTPNGVGVIMIAVNVPVAAVRV